MVVRNSGATDRYVESCMENLIRSDLTEVEKGEALEELKRLLPQTWQDIAAMMGLTRRRVDQMRQVAALSPALQDAVRARSISGRHARQIDLLPDPLKEPALQAVVERGLTVRQVEELVRRLRQPPTPPEDAGEASSPGPATPDGASPPERPDEAGAPAAGQVAATIAGVLDEEGTGSRQRHSVPVVKKLTMIEKALRGIPLHSVGDEDRAEVLARLGRIHEVLAQMERVLS